MKKILIVGGTSGIMLSCLERLLKDKYKITLTYSNKKSLKKIPLKFKNKLNLNYVELDLNNSDKNIINTLREKKIQADIIINAVGGSFGIKEYPFNVEDWKKLLNLNILKHILINNFFIKKMIKKKFGRILFFSTSAVEDKNASIAYSASKAFLENYVIKSASKFGKHNILINCLKTSIVAAKNNNWFKATKQKPAVVDKIAKKLISVEKIGTGDDLVDFIRLAVSPKNRFMNGSIFRIDGGLV